MQNKWAVGSLRNTNKKKHNHSPAARTVSRSVSPPLSISGLNTYEHHYEHGRNGSSDYWLLTINLFVMFKNIKIYLSNHFGTFCLSACYLVPSLCTHHNENPREPHTHTHTHTDVTAVIMWASCPLGAATAITLWTFGGTRLSDDSHLPSLLFTSDSAHTLWLYGACQRTPVVKVKTRSACSVSETQGMFHTSSAFYIIYSHLLRLSGFRVDVTSSCRELVSQRKRDRCTSSWWQTQRKGVSWNIFFFFFFLAMVL